METVEQLELKNLRAVIDTQRLRIHELETMRACRCGKPVRLPLPGIPVHCACGIIYKAEIDPVHVYERVNTLEHQIGELRMKLTTIGDAFRGEEDEDD